MDAVVMRLKPAVSRGARAENPARTKKAEPKPSHGGPVRSARIDRATDKTRNEVPATIHPRERRMDCVIRVLWCKVSMGLRAAALRAGNQAAATTDARPRKTALVQVHGATLSCRTLSKT